MIEYSKIHKKMINYYKLIIILKINLKYKKFINIKTQRPTIIIVQLDKIYI